MDLNKNQIWIDQELLESKALIQIDDKKALLQNPWHLKI